MNSAAPCFRFAGIIDRHDQHPLLQLLRTQQTRANATIPKVRNKFLHFRRLALKVTPNLLHTWGKLRSLCHVDKKYINSCPTCFLSLVSLCYFLILATMAYQTIGIALIAIIFFTIRYLNRTDTPKVKNLPEIPGVPLFGNLLQFGSSHAKVAADLAKKYGPVFQVRLGNRVYLSPKPCAIN